MVVGMPVMSHIPLRQCSHWPTPKGHLAWYKSQYTKESNTRAGNMIIKQAQMEILLDTNWQCMKEWNTLGVMQPPSNSKGHFNWHNRSVDEWVKYPRRQCDHETSLKKNIARHKKTVHGGVKYLCSQCSHEPTSNVFYFNRTVHEGVAYPCRQCDHRAPSQDFLLYTKGQ